MSLKLTFSMHICAKIQFSDVGRRCRFYPDALPNTTARRVEDMGRVQCLLADWDDIWLVVSRIECENDSAILSDPILEVHHLDFV